MLQCTRVSTDLKNKSFDIRIAADLQCTRVSTDLKHKSCDIRRADASMHQSLKRFEAQISWHEKCSRCFNAPGSQKSVAPSPDIRNVPYTAMNQSRKENPQKLTQLSSRFHPRHLVGKRTAQKDTIIDITSDSQVNSNFPNRWSPASLTFNNYFYLFLYLYITGITINNNAPHLKSPKNQNRRAALGRPAIKITGGLQLVCGRPTLTLSSALVPQTLSCLDCVEDS